MAFLTMEVSGRHARTRPITCGAVLPANQPDPATDYASRDVARVVSDVSVLCPRAVVHTGNSSGWGRTFGRDEPFRTGLHASSAPDDPAATCRRAAMFSVGRPHGKQLLFSERCSRRPLVAR